MAINLNTQYPGQMEAPDANYPLGGAKNETAPSAFDGTPFEKAMLNDIIGFQQYLLSKSGITESGSSETALASDYYNAMLILLGEVQKAIASARLVFNALDTVDIVFPYVFADGTTWATISAKSTTTTGKTNGNIYWLGVYVDGTKTYTPSSPPLAADISIAWSASNSTEPSQPTNGVKLGTYLRGVGDAGGDADITSFLHFGKKCSYDVGLGVTLNLDGTPTNFSIADEVSPVAKRIRGYDHLILGTTDGARLTSIFYSGSSGTIQIHTVELQAAQNSSDISKLVALVIIDLDVTQSIRNSGDASDAFGAQDLDTNAFLIISFEEE